jgi:hypothetical protein
VNEVENTRIETHMEFVANVMVEYADKFENATDEFQREFAYNMYRGHLNILNKWLTDYEKGLQDNGE